MELAALRQRIEELEAQNNALQKKINQHKMFEDANGPPITVRGACDYNITDKPFKSAEVIVAKYFQMLKNSPDKGTVQIFDQRYILA